MADPLDIFGAGGDPLDIFGGQEDPLDAFGAIITPEERLRRMRERFPDAMPALGGEEEGQGLLSAGKERMLSAWKSGYLGLADIATRGATRGAGFPGLSVAAHSAEEDRRREMDEFAEATTRAGLPPAATALADTALEAVDPLDLFGGVAGSVAPASRLLRRGARAADVAEGAADAARAADLPAASLREGERLGKGLSVEAIDSWIERLGKGEPGLSSETVDGAEALVYRGPDGRAVSAAVLSPEGKATDLFFTDKRRGLLGARAAVRIGNRLKERGLGEAAGEVSEEALRLRRKLADQPLPIGEEGKIDPFDELQREFQEEAAGRASVAAFDPVDYPVAEVRKRRGSAPAWMKLKSMERTLDRWARGEISDSEAAYQGLVKSGVLERDEAAASFVREGGFVRLADHIVERPPGSHTVAAEMAFEGALDDLSRLSGRDSLATFDTDYTAYSKNLQRWREANENRGPRKLSDKPLPIGQEGKLRPPDDPFQYNAASLDVPDTALPEIRETMGSEKVLTRRRTGVEIDYDDPKSLRAEVGMDEDDFLKTPAGTVWNREQSALLDSYVSRAGRRLEELRAAGKTDTAEFADVKTRWIDLLGTSMAGRSEAGRALESYKHLRTALDSPESLRTYLARKLGGKLDDAELDQLAKADLDDPGELSALIAKIQKPKWWEYPRELFYSSILSGLGTHGRNVVGNAMHAASQIPVRFGAALVDAPLSALTGRQRERYLSETLPALHGLYDGFGDGMVRFRETLRRGIKAPGAQSPEASKFDVPRSAFARAPNAFVREKVAPVVNIPFTMLSAADELFKGINRGAELRALATRSGVRKGLSGDELVEHVSKFLADPPEDALKKAIQFEQKMTFTNPLGPVARHLENLKNSSPFLGYFIPFVRTPINLFKRGAEFTPFNLPRAVQMGAKGAEGAADEMAKVAVGTAMMSWVGMKAAAGELTGPPPAEAGERDAFYQQGKQPFSVKFGDRWYSFSQIEPLAMPLALVASASEGFKRGEGDATTFERLQKSMSLLLANQLDRSYLSGLSDFVELKTFGEQALVGWGGRQAAALGVPFSGAMRTVANTLDPRIVEKRRLRDYAMESIPGLKQELPARLTRFGEDIRKTRWQAAGPSGTPLVPTKETDDEVEQVLEQLGLTVGFPGKSIEGVELSPDEYRSYLQEVGPKTKEVLRYLLTDESFQQLPQDFQQRTVDRFVRSTRDVARTEALMGAIPDVPPLAVKKQLAGAAAAFNGDRSRFDGISARYNEATRNRGQKGVGELFEAAEQADEEWSESYSALQQAAKDARRQGLDERAIFDLLRRQGLSARLARALVRGEIMSYQDYRDGRR